MASIQARKRKSGTYYELVEWALAEDKGIKVG